MATETYVRIKRKRKSNFSHEEEEMLLHKIKEHKNTLFGKLSPNITFSKREHAWRDVLNSVNAVSADRRTLDEIKAKWKRHKMSAKMKFIQRRKRLKPPDSPKEEMVLDIIGHPSIEGKPASVEKRDLEDASEIAAKIKSEVNTEDDCFVSIVSPSPDPPLPPPIEFMAVPEIIQLPFGVNTVDAQSQTDIGRSDLTTRTLEFQERQVAAQERQAAAQERQAAALEELLIFLRENHRN